MRDFLPPLPVISPTSLKPVNDSCHNTQTGHIWRAGGHLQRLEGELKFSAIELVADLENKNSIYTKRNAMLKDN